MSRLRALRRPESGQRAIFAVKWIGPGKRNSRHDAALAFHVVMRLAPRIGSDHLEALVAADAFVPDSGWKHEHVAGLQAEQAPVVAA